MFHKAMHKKYNEICLGLEHAIQELQARILICLLLASCSQICQTYCKGLWTSTQLLLWRRNLHCSGIGWRVIFKRVHRQKGVILSYNGLKHLSSRHSIWIPTCISLSFRGIKAFCVLLLVCKIICSLPSIFWSFLFTMSFHQGSISLLRE